MQWEGGGGEGEVVRWGRAGCHLWVVVSKLKPVGREGAATGWLWVMAGAIWVLTARTMGATEVTAGTTRVVAAAGGALGASRVGSRGWESGASTLNDPPTVPKVVAGTGSVARFMLMSQTASFSSVTSS